MKPARAPPRSPLRLVVALLLLLALVATSVTAFIRVPSSRPALLRLPFTTPSTSSTTTSSSRSSRPPSARPLPVPAAPWQRPPSRALRAAGGAAAGSGGHGHGNGSDLRAKVLATVQSLYFPLTVLGAGLLGAWKPGVYAGLSEGFVTRALAAVMVLMGATLTLDDFRRIGRSRRAVLLGWCAQFSIMPSMALLMSRLYSLPPHLAAGVVLVGCCPGGTASNLVTLLAEADVALSVTMTAVSTMTAGVMTPLLTSLILGALVPVDTRALVVTTLQVVLLPVVLGLLTNTYLLPRLSPAVTRQLNNATPVLSGLLVAAICGKVVSANASAVVQAGLPLLLAIVSLHIFGFLFGFVVARVLGFSRKVAKTVSIETGMQNSALAVVLARNSLPHPLSGLPGCVSAVCHSVIGSVLAFVWSRESPAKKEEK